MATLTSKFIAENKVNNGFQMIVNYLGHEMIITNMTEKNIMLKQISKIHRGNCGFGNSGRFIRKNDENSTQWYLENRNIRG
jgi:hypothetical protein